jgi:CHAP domain
MANEEVLRLKTTVITDEAFQRIRQLEQALARMQASGGQGLRRVNIEATTLTRTFTTMQREAAAAGATMGRALGAIGVSLTVGAIAQKINDVSKRILDLSYANRELGMSERHVRAYMAAAEKSGVSSQTMAQGIRSARESLDGLRYASSAVRENLLRLGGGREVIRMLNAIKDPAERFREIMMLKDTILGGPEGQHRAEALFRALNMPLELIRVKAEDAANEYKNLTDRTGEQEEASRKLIAAQVDLTRELDDAAARSLPTVARGITKIIQLYIDWDKWTDKVRESMQKGSPQTPEDFQQHYQGGGGREQFYGPPKATVPSAPSTAVPDILKEGIPPFQSGGISRRGGLSMLHPNEAVIPLGQRDVLEGSEQTLEKAEEEGTYRALKRFYHDSREAEAAGLGRNLGGMGGGGVGGGGGGGGGGSAPGGTGQSSGGQDESTSKSDGSQAPALTPEEQKKAGVITTPAPAEQFGPPDPGKPEQFGPPTPAGFTSPGAPAAGTPGAPAGGQISPNLLMQAKQMVLKGGKPAQVQEFLRKHGENANEAWCGHFAAAVVKEAGGKPPAGSATATNWRNFGTEVSAAEARPGDIAVTKKGQTGKSGGHVTIVGPEGVNAKSGTFEAVGGNQRSGVTGHRTSAYTFRRAPAGNDQPATARQENQTTPGGARVSERQQGDSPAGQANVRTNNPGAQYPSPQAKRFGMSGQSVIGGGHKIAHFPTPVHGAASNFALLASKYTGKTVAQAMKMWSGGSRSVPGPGGKPYDPNMVITPEMARDPAFAVPFMKALTSGEGRGRYPMSDAQWQQAHQWALAGQVPAGAQALARNEQPAGATTTATRPDLARAPHPLDKGAPDLPGEPTGQPGTGVGMSQITDPAYLEKMRSYQNRLITPETHAQVLMEESRKEAGIRGSVDRANGAQVSPIPPSSVNVDVRHDGTRASARAQTKGPAFAETKVANQSQMQRTDEFGSTVNP